MNARLLCLAVFVFGMAQLPTVNVSAVDKSIDKRTQTDADGNKYYVIFCARGGSLTGHAFVTWGVEDNRRQQCIAQSFGFYPVNGTGAFGAIPGAIRNEALNPKTTLITDRLTVRVNRSVYLQSQNAIGRWATTKFSLYSNNCISFTADVAGRCGLTVPPKGTLIAPSSYIQLLIGKN